MHLQKVALVCGKTQGVTVTLVKATVFLPPTVVGRGYAGRINSWRSGGYCGKCV